MWALLCGCKQASLARNKRSKATISIKVWPFSAEIDHAYCNMVLSKFTTIPLNSCTWKSGGYGWNKHHYVVTMTSLRWWCNVMVCIMHEQYHTNSINLSVVHTHTIMRKWINCADDWLPCLFSECLWELAWHSLYHEHLLGFASGRSFVQWSNREETMQFDTTARSPSIKWGHSVPLAHSPTFIDNDVTVVRSSFQNITTSLQAVQQSFPLLSYCCRSWHF